MYSRKSNSIQFEKDPKSTIKNITGRNYQFQVNHFSSIAVQCDTSDPSQTIAVTHRYFVPDILSQPHGDLYRFVSMITPKSDIPVADQERLVQSENFKLGFEREHSLCFSPNLTSLAFDVTIDEDYSENIYIKGDVTPHKSNFSMKEKIMELKDRKTFYVALKKNSIVQNGIVNCALSQNGENVYISPVSIDWLNNTGGEGMVDSRL